MNYRWLVVAAASACTSNPAPDQVSDTQPPVLQILTPDRGAMQDGNQVTVTGLVTDDYPLGFVTVTVNGTAASLSADGTFSAEIAVGSGIQMIETHATDGGGNDARDVRAMLAGTLATTDGKLVSPLGAMLGASGFHTLGGVIATQAKQLDFTALGLAMNPVYTSSGCNSATIDIETIDVGDITADLIPGANTLAANVVLDNVVATLHVDFRAVCISGSATVDIGSTHAHVTGNLALALTAGHVVATMPAAAVVLDGFSINIHNVPGALESLIKGKAQSAIETALTNAVKSKVPQIATTALSSVVPQALTTSMLGHDVHMSVAPSGVSLAPDGLFVTASTKLALVGGETGTFASVASPLTSTTIAAPGFGLAIASDTINQLLSGAWAAGAFEDTIANLGGVGGLLDPDAHSMAIHPLLPPAISADGGTLALSLGDMILSVRDASGVEIQQIAVSLATPLQISSSAAGELAFTLGDPIVKAQVLVQAGDAVLADSRVEAIITGGWGLLASKAKDALAGLHLPAMSGVTLGAPTVVGTSGYVVANISLQ